jgi:hypothetical protein
MSSLMGKLTNCIQKHAPPLTELFGVMGQMRNSLQNQFQITRLNNYKYHWLKSFCGISKEKKIY